MADITVVEVPDQRRYEVLVDGARAGLVTYRTRPGLVELLHTEVDDAYEGQGVGSALVAGVLGDLRARGMKVKPTCPFVRAWIERHPEEQELVAPI